MLVLRRDGSHRELSLKVPVSDTKWNHIEYFKVLKNYLNITIEELILINQSKLRRINRKVISTASNWNIELDEKFKFPASFDVL